MKKIWFLSTCSTCQRIMKDLGINEGNFELQDIRSQPLTSSQLEKMKKMAGSYEALFSRKALKYRAMGLHERKLSENEMKDLILTEYTFLKRPVIISGLKIFIGNSPSVVKEAKSALSA